MVIEALLRIAKKVETTQMSINWWINKQCGAYAYNGMWFSHTRERSADTCYNLDELGKRYASQRSQTQKSHIASFQLYEISRMLPTLLFSWAKGDRKTGQVVYLEHHPNITLIVLCRASAHGTKVDSFSHEKSGQTRFVWYIMWKTSSFSLIQSPFHEKHSWKGLFPNVLLHSEAGLVATFTLEVFISFPPSALLIFFPKMVI